MSSFYLDILKDRLYTHGTHSLSRRSAQTVLYNLLDTIVRLIAPILPFTAEEVYQAMSGTSFSARGDETVHALFFPKYKAEHDSKPLIEEWEKLAAVRETVLKALEKFRQAGEIGNGLEAKVILHSGSETAALLRRHAADLRYLFIVSHVEIKEEPGEMDLRVEVDRAEGNKCERCWNYSPEVGVDPDFPMLCERCVPVVREIRIR